MLNIDEIANPHDVLAECFEAHSLQDIRIYLRDWLILVWQNDDVIAGNYLWPCESIQKLIESAFVYYQLKANKIL